LSNAKQSIAIIGAGRIGSAYAFQLARAGHAVTVVARPGSVRLAQLSRDGGIVRDTGEQARVTVADHLDEQQPYDLVIVTTLAHQVDAVLPALQRSAAKGIHFMFVTPEYKRLAAAVGEQRATFGMASVLSVVKEDGTLQLDVQKTRSAQGDQGLVDLFTGAGLPSQLQPEMGRWLRSQVPLTIAMESVAGAAVRHGRGATRAEAAAGARGFRAGLAIVRGAGETPYPGNNNQMSRTMSRMPAAVVAFIMRSVSRGKFRETVGNSAAECRGLIDILVAEGRQQPELRDAVSALLALRPVEAAKAPATR